MRLFCRNCARSCPVRVNVEVTKEDYLVTFVSYTCSCGASDKRLLQTLDVDWTILERDT